MLFFACVHDARSRSGAFKKALKIVTCHSHCHLLMTAMEEFFCFALIAWSTGDSNKLMIALFAGGHAARLSSVPFKKTFIIVSFHTRGRLMMITMNEFFCFALLAWSTGDSNKLIFCSFYGWTCRPLEIFTFKKTWKLLVFILTVVFFWWRWRSLWGSLL